MALLSQIKILSEDDEKVSEPAGLQGSPRRWFGENASLLISANNVREVGYQRQLNEHFLKFINKIISLSKSNRASPFIQKECVKCKEPPLCNLCHQNNEVNWLRRGKWLIVILLLNSPHLKKSWRNFYRVPGDWFQATCSSKHNLLWHGPKRVWHHLFLFWVTLHNRVMFQEWDHSKRHDCNFRK